MNIAPDGHSILWRRSVSLPSYQLDWSTKIRDQLEILHRRVVAAPWHSDWQKFGMKDYPVVDIEGDCEDKCLWWITEAVKLGLPPNAFRVMLCFDLGQNDWHAIVYFPVYYKGAWRTLIMDPATLIFKTVGSGEATRYKRVMSLYEVYLGEPKLATRTLEDVPLQKQTIPTPSQLSALSTRDSAAPSAA